MAEIIEFAKPEPTSLLVTTDIGKPEDLAGRVLMLNVASVRKFTCYGFIVTQHSKTAQVPKQADFASLQQALLTGKLIDVTGKMDPTKVSVKEEDTGMKAFITQNSDGQILVTIPKDEADLEILNKKVANGGYVTVDDTKEVVIKTAPEIGNSRVADDRLNTQLSEAANFFSKFNK